MANVRSANSYYIDTQYATNEELAVKNLIVVGVFVRATSAGGRVVLTDSGTNKLDLQVDTANRTEFFPMADTPVLFTTSIRPTTLSNAIVTVIFRETRA